MVSIILMRGEGALGAFSPRIWNNHRDGIAIGIVALNRRRVVALLPRIHRRNALIRDAAVINQFIGIVFIVMAAGSTARVPWARVEGAGIAELHELALGHAGT